MRKTWPLLALIGILVVAGGGLLFQKEAPVIEMRNLDRPAAVVRIEINPSEPFFVFYTHSMYDEPVTEEFSAGAQGFVLRGVETRSPGVMEYYGFEAPGGVQPVHRVLGNAFVIQRGPRADQGVRAGRKTVFLHEMAEEGDRVRLEVKQIPLGLYWWYLLSASSLGS
jgi:hypothetical protein